MKKLYSFLLLFIFFTSNNSLAQCTGLLASAVGTNNQTICLGTPIARISYYFLLPGIITGSVSNLPPGVTAAVSVDSIIISGTPTIPGVFNYVINYSNCLPFSNSIPSLGTIKVNPRPTAHLSLTGPGVVCLNQTSDLLITFTGASPWSGHLLGTSNDPYLVAGNFPVTVTMFTPSITVNYSLTDLQDANGCISLPSDLTGSASVYTKPLPEPPSVNSPVTYCFGSTSVPLTTESGDSLLWYLNSIGGIGTSIAPSPSTSIPGNTSYYVSQVEDGCEGNRNVIIANVIPSIPVPVTANISYCVGVTANPLTATGNGLLWYTSPTGGTGTSTAPTASTDNVGNTSYYVSQTINTCESPRAEIVVTVNSIPLAPDVVSPVNYCQGSTSSFLTASGPGNLLWYTAAIGGIGDQVAPAPSTAALGSTSFYVSQTIDGCESSREEIIVNVSERPTANVTGGAEICLGQTANIEITFTGIGPWYGTLLGSSPNPDPFFTLNNVFTVTVTPTTNVTYSVTALTDDGNGCSSTNADLTGSAIIIVNTQIPAPPQVVSPVSICQGTGDFTPAAEGAGLLWYVNPTGGSGTTIGPILPTDNPVDTSFYVSQTEGGCEGTRAEIIVVVNPTPIINPVHDTSFCNGEPVTGINFTSTTPNANFNWVCDPSIGFSEAGSGNISSFFAQNTGSVPIVAYDTVRVVANGCPGPAIHFTATVNPSPPKPDFNWLILGVRHGICIGSNINFNVISAVDDVSYLWNTIPLNNQDVSIQDTNSPNTVISFFNTGTDTIQVFAMNPAVIGGCKDSIKHIVQVVGRAGIAVRKIFKKQPGNLLIYPDNSIQNYQWGYDSLLHIMPDTAYGPPVNVDGQVYQFFIPPDRFIVNNELDTIHYAYWVLIDDGCYGKVYYNGPYATGRMQTVPQDDNTVRLNLFPNPNNGIFDIVLKGDIYGSMDTKIYNVMGQVVFTNKFEKTTAELNKKFDIGKLSSGLYYLVIQSSDLKKLVARFIIQQ